MASRVSYRILSWGGGGGERMIVASVQKHTHAHISMRAYQGGLGACPPPPPPPPLLQKNFEFRSSQIASEEIWDKIVV